MNETNKKVDVKRITLVGMFGAISAILMLLEFPVVFIVPDFIKFDLSELPIILAGYMMGPIAGIWTIVVKIALKLMITGTHTAGIGEISNAIGSLCYMLPAVLIYRHKKSRAWAAGSLAIGTVFTSVVLLITNTTFVFPFYAKAFFGGSMDAIVGMFSGINSHIDGVATMMLLSVFPFNLMKYGVVSVITFIVYKRLKKALRL